MRYVKIASRFAVYGPPRPAEYLGPVIVSKDAFFLVPELTLEAGVLAVLINILAAFGLPLARLLDRASSKTSGPLQVPMSELPKVITADPEWPLRSWEGSVLVLPKALIRSIGYSPTGHLELSSSRYKFKIAVWFSSRSKITKALRTLEWSL